MAVTAITTGIANGSAVCTLPDGTLAVACGPRNLRRYDRSGTLLDDIALDAGVQALASSPTGAGVLAVSPGTGLWYVSFDTGSSSLLRRLPGAVGLAVDPVAASSLVGRRLSGGGLLQLPLASSAGGRRVVADGIGRPHAVAARPGAPTAWVLVGGANRSILGVDLASGNPIATALGRPRIPGLGAARDLAWAGQAGTTLAVAGGSEGRILMVDTAQATPGGGGDAPQVLEQGLDAVWSVDLLPPENPGDPAMLLAGIGDSLAVVDLPNRVTEVELEMPATPVYLSGWARIGVALNGSRSLDDLLFVIDPPEGGTVSVSRDATFEHHPSVLLAAGALPGRYALLALDASSGSKLAAADFTIAETWDGLDGPPVAIIGEHATDSPDPAWGGGDPFGPQNLRVTPQLGTRQVAVVIAETTDVTALSANDQAALGIQWQNEVFNGVVRDGVAESVRAYYRDVSDTKLDLGDAGVVGVLRLGNNWDSYVAASQIDATGKTHSWDGFARAVVAEIRTRNAAAAASGNPPVVDLTTVESIILVLRTVPAAGMFPGRFVWPSATRPGNYELTFEIDRQTMSYPTPFGSINVTIPVYRTIQIFAMPDDWVIQPDNGGRVRRETAAHELGHNLGLPDEYWANGQDADAKALDLASSTTRGASWSLMSWEERFPQMCVVEKMMLGWVDRQRVRNLSFATLGPVNENLTLHASNTPTPNGEYAAVEVRISDGVNYYFEYRQEEPTTTSDEDIPADDTVLGVKCWSGEAPKEHRNILKLKDDGDGDNAEFGNGDDYRERDTSDPSYPNDFEMNVLSTGPDSAQVHITYGDRKPDPQIRPWAASTNWQSPDLQVTNARNAADARYRNIPWENHDNRIVATVRNPAGQLDAFSVRVNFFVRDYTLGGGAETPLGSDQHDVPAGQEVQFTSSLPWVPPPLSLIPFITIPVHYCVVARIAEYHDPVNPAVGEITRDNNEAQSNITQVISATASPASRETGFVKVTNPLPRSANCRVQVRQTSEFARTYLEHAWVWLDPGEEREVMFLTETLLGDPALGRWAMEQRGKIYEVPNRIRLTGVVDRRGACHGHVTGGAEVLVRAGRATEFIDFEHDGGLASGEIRGVDDGQGVDGTVLVSLWPREAPEKGRVREGRAVDGGFRVETGQVPDDWLVQGHYLGQFDLAPCDSRILDR